MSPKSGITRCSTWWRLKTRTCSEKYLLDRDLEPDEIRKVIRKGTINQDFVPVLCGSAFKNKGVQPLLDAVVAYLPSPMDLAAMQGFRPGNETEYLERRPSDDEPFSALAFKIMSDLFVGKLTYFRVYSGVADKGDAVVNTTNGKKERFGRLLRMHADKQEDIDQIVTGDIVAAVGLKFTRTGDTLAAPNAPIQLESMTFPEPVISVAIEPEDQVRSGQARQRTRPVVRGGSHVSGSRRRGNGPDDHFRDGRASPRDHRRPAAA